LAEILKEHTAWLNDGGPGNSKLANDPKIANLCDTNLAGAHLNSAHLNSAHLTKTVLFAAGLKFASLDSARLSDADLNSAYLNDAYFIEADLTGADLKFADLTGANLVDAQVSKAKLYEVNLTDAAYAPESEPPHPYVAGIKGLATIRAVPGDEIGLIQLRKLLQDAGLRDGAREATYSIQHNVTRDQLWNGAEPSIWLRPPTSRFPNPTWFVDILRILRILRSQSRFPRATLFVGSLRTIGLGWTTACGLHPERALRWIRLLGLIVTPVYMLAMLRPTPKSGGCEGAPSQPARWN
jgi:hypothetical protein